MRPAIIPFQFPQPAADGLRHLTVAEIVRLYLELRGPELSAKTLYQRRQQFQLFAAKFGSLSWDALHKSDLKRWVRDRAEWRSDHSKRNALKAVKALYQWAADDDRIPRNPFARVSWPEGKSGRSMTDAEYARLQRHSPPYCRRAHLFLRETSARPQDVENISWPDVTEAALANGWVELAKHKTAKKTGRPKVVYLSDLAVRLLRWLRREWGNRPPSDRGEHVFDSHSGQRLRAQRLSERFWHLRERLRGSHEEIPDDCKLYGLRHAVLNKSQIAGNDIRTTADIGGHGSTVTTERYYLHQEERRQSIREALNRATRAKL